MILVFDPNPALERVALVEEFAPGEPRRPMRVSTYAGGAGLRAAHVARQSGADVLALGFVGGRLGELLRDGLDRQDIPHVLTPIAADTRGDFLLLDKEKGVVTEIPEAAPAISEAEAERLLGTLERHLRGSALLVAAGSPDADPAVVARALELARDAGIPTAADLRGPAIEAAAETGVWLLRMNLKTFQSRTERSLQYDSAILAEARDLVGRGVGNVLVTLGVEGALLVNAEGAWRVKPPVVSHFNPTGSGEALVGALAARWEHEPDLLDAVRYGCAAGSVNVTHDEPGFATPGEIAVLLPKTTAERVA
jgi:1-phosphofructokinase family hexose kinase